MAGRRQNFTIFQNEAFNAANDHKINDGAWRLYCALLTYRNNDTGKTFPSYSTLAKKLNRDRRTVIRHMQELTDAGLIEVVPRFPEGQQTSNDYRFPLESDPEPAPRRKRAARAATPRPQPRRESRDLTTMYDGVQPTPHIDPDSDKVPF